MAAGARGRETGQEDGEEERRWGGRSRERGEQDGRRAPLGGPLDHRNGWSPLDAEPEAADPWPDGVCTTAWLKNISKLNIISLNTEFTLDL